MYDKEKRLHFGKKKLRIAVLSSIVHLRFLIASTW